MLKFAMLKRILFCIWAVLATTGTALAATEIQEVDSPKGIHAWLVQEPSIPFIAFSFHFQGGTLLDANDKSGATNLMTELLDQGAGDLSAEAFSRRAEELAAHFTFKASRGSVTISAQVLKSNMDEALALLKSAIHAPRFDADALARTKQQTISSIESKGKNPRDIANTALVASVFGDHPYARTVEGSVETVGDLTHADLTAAHARVFVRDRVFIGAVGDITATDLGAVLDDLIAGLPLAEADLPAKAAYKSKGGVQVIDFDTPQTVLRWSLPTLTRDDPDFFAAFVLNHIIGGSGFQARLYTEIREKRGLTYGINSYLATSRWGDFWGGGMATANDRVAEAVGLIREQIQQIADNGVSEAELSDAKKFLTGAYPLRFDGNERIVQILSGMQADKLGVDYIATRNPQVEAVSLAQINAVAKRLMDAEGLNFVLVGRPEGVVRGE